MAQQTGEARKAPHLVLWNEPMPIRDDLGTCRTCRSQLVEFRTLIYIGPHHCIDKFERRCERCNKAESVAYHDYRSGARAQNEAQWWKKIARKAEANA